MNDQLAPLLSHLQVFEDAKKALELAGLPCLTQRWMGANHAYQFRCQRGHIFERHGSIFSYGGPKRCQTCEAIEHIQHLHKLAADEGVKCLDTDWLGGAKYYRFECSKGHVWSRAGTKARLNMRCPICVRGKHAVKVMLPDGLQRLQEAAQRRGGQCLSTSYDGGYLMYKFRCKAQHQWQANGSEVLRGSWCLLCSHQEKSESYLLPDGLTRLHDLAQKKGGKCLASTYTGSNEKYGFVCARGHHWQTTAARIVRGAWCVQCAYDKKRLSIGDAREAASRRGGQCLSEQYVSSTQKLEWMCERGHVWKAPLNAIRQNHWCFQCAVIARIHKPKSKALAKYMVGKGGK